MGPRITSIYRAGPAYVTGLNVGDEIIQVNQVDFSGVDKLLADKKVGDVLKVRVRRDGLERTFDLVVGQTPLKSFAIQSIEKPSELQLKLRHKWLGGN